MCPRASSAHQGGDIHGTARIAIAAVALSAAAGAVGLAQAGGETGPGETARAAHRTAQSGTAKEPNVVVAKFSGAAARGVVFAVRHPRRRAVRMGVSLHGLDPSRSYVVVAVSRGCSRKVAEEEFPRLALFRSPSSWEVEDFGEFPARLTGGLGAARSLRVYEREQEAELVERACARSAVFIGGGAATGALIG